LGRLENNETNTKAKEAAEKGAIHWQPLIPMAVGVCSEHLWPSSSRARQAKDFAFFVAGKAGFSAALSPHHFFSSLLNLNWISASVGRLFELIGPIIRSYSTSAPLALAPCRQHFL